MRLLLRVFLGLVLLGSGVVKVLHPGEFLLALQAYALPLPGGVWPWVAACFPWLEAIVGVALIFDRWADPVRPLAVGLFALFAVVLGQAVLRGLTLDCGCFGRLLPGWFERPPAALLRALVLLATAGVVWRPRPGEAAVR